MTAAPDDRSGHADVLDDLPTVKRWMDEIDGVLHEARRLNDSAWDLVFSLKEELYDRLDARLAADEADGAEAARASEEAV